MLSLSALLHLAAWTWLNRAPAGPGRTSWDDFPLDDAWIHMVYGRSLARTGLPLYNDAVEPGFTSPLWMGVLALAHLVQGAFRSTPPVLLVKLAGLLLAWGCGVLLALTLLRARLSRGAPLPRVLALLAPLWVAVDPHFAFAAASGMEVPLLSFAAALAGYFLVSRRPGRACAALAAAVLARPEGMLLVPLAALCALGEDRPWRMMALLVLPAAASAAAWSCLCLASSGHPFPNTFYNKVASPGSAVPLLGSLLSSGIGPWSVAGFGAGLLLLVPGTVHPLLRRSGAEERGGGLALLLLGPWAIVLGVALSRRILEPESFYFQRYFLPALPLFLVPLLAGSDLLARALGGRRGRLAAGVLLGILLLMGAAQLPQRRALFGANCRDIRVLNVGTGLFIREHTAPGAVVGTNDAGAVRYFGERRTVDVVGLNDWRFLFPGTAADAMLSTRFTHFALSPGILERVKDRGTRLLHRALVGDNSLFSVSPYWIDLLEVQGAWGGPAPRRPDR